MSRNTIELPTHARWRKTMSDQKTAAQRETIRI